MISHIIIIAMAIISGIAGMISILINILYEHYSEKTEASIIRCEIRLKSFDSTIEKRIGYDYVYEYKDVVGNKHIGKIIKNSPVIEFSEGEKISIRYIKKLPAFSLYQKISTIPFVLIAMSAILFTINLII